VRIGPPFFVGSIFALQSSELSQNTVGIALCLQDRQVFIGTRRDSGLGATSNGRMVCVVDNKETAHPHQSVGVLHIIGDAVVRMTPVDVNHVIGAYKGRVSFNPRRHRRGGIALDVLKATMREARLNVGKTGFYIGVLTDIKDGKFERFRVAPQ
jgi:hypothetical protein